MADDLEMQQRRLRTKKTLEELQNMRGMGTELVTVIIPLTDSLVMFVANLAKKRLRLRTLNPN